MHVAELWRYPIKSMRGERVDRATVTRNGIEGDRVLSVRLPTGGVATARRYPQLLTLAATLSENGHPLVNGQSWEAEEVARLVEAATMAGARLVPSDDQRFDILPLLVATDGAIEAFGYDGRRLRANILLGGVDGLAERDWEGHTLTVGAVRIRLADLRDRCVMTTVDPDTNERDPGVLKSIVQRFDGRLALNADIARGGTIAVGDEAGIET